MTRSTRRAVAARETRERIVAAAHACFLERGFPDTTIREVATRADVSPETIYKGFRGKAGLLKAAYDRALAGDDESIPIAQRPQAQAVRDAVSPRAAAAAYAELSATLVDRAGPLTRVVLAGRGASAEIEEFAATVDAERLTGTSGIVRRSAEQGWLTAQLSVEAARDTVWILTSPAVYILTLERGWSTHDYCNWLTHALLGQVLDDDPTTAVAPADRSNHD